MRISGNFKSATFLDVARPFDSNIVIMGSMTLDFIHVSVKHCDNLENIYAMCKINLKIDDGSIF